jgi:energy-coupling factor transporter transmembrane protein EcfT
MNSQYVKVIVFFILAFVWFYSLGIFSYWVVYRHIRTKRAWNTLQFIQALAMLIGLCFVSLAGHSVELINSILPNERSDDVSAVVLGSIVLPLVAVFPTMKFIFPKIWKEYWEIRKSILEKPD